MCSYEVADGCVEIQVMTIKSTVNAWQNITRLALQSPRQCILIRYNIINAIPLRSNKFEGFKSNKAPYGREKQKAKAGIKSLNKQFRVIFTFWDRFHLCSEDMLMKIRWTEPGDRRSAQRSNSFSPWGWWWRETSWSLYCYCTLHPCSSASLKLMPLICTTLHKHTQRRVPWQLTYTVMDQNEHDNSIKKLPGIVHP